MTVLRGNELRADASPRNSINCGIVILNVCIPLVDSLRSLDTADVEHDTFSRWDDDVVRCLY